MTTAPPATDPRDPTEATRLAGATDAADAPWQSGKQLLPLPRYIRLGGSGARRAVAWGSDDGRVTAFTVVFATAVLLFAGLVLDGGLALAAKVRAVGEAQEAARAGAQAIDLGAYRADGTLRLEPDRAAALARRYLTDAGAEPVTATVTVSGDSVTVTVRAMQSTRLLGLVGVHSIRVTGTGTAHPERGPAAGNGAGP